MKAFTLLLIVLFFSMVPVQAQDEEETDQDFRPMRGGLVGAGAGVTPMWLFLNVGELNKSLVKAAMPEFSNSGMFLMGGAGFAYIGFVKNLRIGGIGAGGSMMKQTATNTSEIGISFGGGTIEYVIPFGNFHVAIGGMIGGGSTTLTLTKNQYDSRPWDDIFSNDIPGNSSSVRHEMTNGFFSYQPMLSLDYIPHPLIMAKLSGGYFGMSGKTWQLDNKTNATDVPDLKMGSGFIQLGIFVGAFLSN